MKRLIQYTFLLGIMAVVSASAIAQETLIFSEYIEGSSNNKAIELYNPNSTAVSLDSYQIAQSNNGGGWQYYHTFPAGASIPAGGTWVMVTNQVDTALYDTTLADEVLAYPSLVHHNGNDARAIVHISGSDTTLIDVFGDPDSDDYWTVGDTEEGSREYTLVRKSKIMAGNTVSLGSFGTDDISSEWIVYSQNDFSHLGSHSVSVEPFTLRDFNYYPFPLPDVSPESIQAHPLNDSVRTFTAVITSYPRSSGLATPNDTDSDGTIDDIGRVHVFVTDTSANTMGRAGMSIQVVESDYELLAGYTRGDVVTLTGRLTFFNSTSQVTVEDDPVLLGNVNSEPTLADYAHLLDPWMVSLDEINTFHEEDGTHEVKYGNYSKYNGAYVKIENASVSNVSLGDRPNWAISESGTRIYVYDTSLRFRNDRVAYLPGWNFRQAPDPTFEPPAPGSVVNLSGFINLVGDDPDGNVTEGSSAFSINPMEDGVLWLNGTRYENGDDIGGGTLLSWPNDLEIIGIPPVFSEVSLSDSSATSSDAVTVSATVTGADGATISSVDLVYSAAGVTDTLAMVAAGDVYTALIPAQLNFTAVSFYMLAEDSEGLIGRNPIAGTYGYFVQDAAINTVALVQTTADGGAGPSPVAGAGVLEFDLTGTIVADAAEDGVIILQDAAAAWSGVFLEHTTETDALVKGDEITITAAEAAEAAVASNSLTLTQLVNLTFTKTGTADPEALIPSITTDQVAAMLTGDEIEPYEGMVVKFENAIVTEAGVYGEYTVETADADSGSVLFNEDIRASATIGDVNVDYAFNYSVRQNKPMTIYAVVAASFGDPKFHPRNAGDFVATDGNAFTPVLDFGLVDPVDSASVTADADMTFSWGTSEDFDGDDVSYIFAIYDGDDLVGESDAISGTSITFEAAEVDSFLVANGVADGETGDFWWTVWVTDGSDTLQVHGPYGNFGDDFEPIGRAISITNSAGVAIDDEFGVPQKFALEQNYPNPFNPSTNIRFALPKSSAVTLVIYDMLGRKVATLIDGTQMKAANHTVRFDAAALASGMYIYRLEAGSFVSTRKMMLIK